LIIEEHQCHQVSLLDPSRMPYLTVTFDAPLFGIWSPAKKNAPFICIEPWFGYSDTLDQSGQILEKEGIQVLEAKNIFHTAFSIEIL
jgi:galactose mutarotase-like enzyme